MSRPGAKKIADGKPSQLDLSRIGNRHPNASAQDDIHAMPDFARVNDKLPFRVGFHRALLQQGVQLVPPQFGEDRELRQELVVIQDSAW